MIPIDIFGACTIRDTFEISKLLKSKYHVNIFIQNNSPLTLGFTPLKKLGITISNIDFKNSSNCWYKWFDLNANEKVYQHLKDNHSEYLILNLTETYYNYYRIKNDLDEVRICEQQGIKINNITEFFGNYEKISPLSLDDDEIERLISRFASIIKSIYLNKIILIKNLPSQFYIKNKTKFLYDFNNPNHNEICNFLLNIYNKFIKCFEKLIIIDLPTNSPGYYEHRWGLGSQHYINKVYEYLGDSIDYSIEQLTHRINPYKINYVLYNKSLEFNNIINSELANHKLYKSPFIDFCLKYSYIRVLLITPDFDLPIFKIEEKHCIDSIYQPQWVKTGYSQILISNKGELRFSIITQQTCNLIIYLQSLDSRSKNNKHYEIFIYVTDFEINNSNITKNKLISHNKPYKKEIMLHKEFKYNFYIKFEPNNY